MATFGEIVYMVMDLLKEQSDDSYYTEQHILFLASKMRAVLIERKYRHSRNTAFQLMSDDNKQTICLDVEPASDLSSGCSGGWLQSTAKLPATFAGTPVDVYPVNDLLNANVTYIAPERMPFVGHNKWLKNIIYCSRSNDGRLYMNSVNPQFMYLEKVKATGVFSNPVEAAELSCNGSEDAGACDIMDKKFPIEDALIPPCIEMVVQELAAARYAPEDRKNDAKDDLGDVRMISKPQETTTPRRQDTEQ